MATSSLTNFTVPLSTDQSASSQGLIMPKLSYRFRITFLNLGVSQPTTELTKQVISCGRPSVKFDPIELPVYNSVVTLLGKPKWDPIKCKIRDDASGEVSKLIGEQLQKQFDFYEQASAASGIDYKFTTIFEVLDGGNGTSSPNTLETWEMYGCQFMDVTYSGGEYAKGEAMDIDLGIKFDNAIQSPIGTGVGSTVSRTLGQIATG